jgi:hypothetical protein
MAGSGQRREFLGIKDALAGRAGLGDGDPSRGRSVEGGWVRAISSTSPRPGMLRSPTKVPKRHLLDLAQPDHAAARGHPSTYRRSPTQACPRAAA